MNHQQHQIKIIDQIEKQIKANSLKSSTVSPVTNFENDSRICLTSVHFPALDLMSYISKSIINPLKKISPEHYYYSDMSFHITIKNIRVIHDPPNFTSENIKTVREVFSKIVSRHNKFKVYFYRLLLFPNNLALMGTTEQELDNIILDLDKCLTESGVPDDKQYVNSKYFFCNMTLARFNSDVNQKFVKTVQELSKNIKIDPYIVDSVSLITANAVLSKLQIIDTWKMSHPREDGDPDA